jgi:DNA-directed DNA polymerase
MYNLFNKPTREYSIIVDTVSKLKKLVEKMKDLQEFAFDTETNTLQVAGENREFICVGISISWGRFNNYYIPMGHRRVEDYKRNLSIEVVQEYLQPIFNREDVRIIGHNLKYDMHVLKRIGISIATKDFFDTMLASWLLDENTPNGLKQITSDNLNVPQTHFAEVIDSVPAEVKKEFGLKATNKATFDLTLIDESAFYALDDPFYTYYNYMYLLDELEKDGMDKIYFKKMIPFMIVLFNMEERGITVDREALDEMNVNITKDMENLLYDMTEILGVEFNPNSNQQLQAILFGYVKDIKKPDEVTPKKGISPIQEIREKYEGKKNWTEERIQKKIADLWAKYDETMGEWKVFVENGFDFKPTSTTSAGAPSTDSGSLWTLSHKEYKVKRKREGVEFCSLLLEYKRLAKLKSAFIDGLESQLYDDGKAHCSFNQIGTTSGRISCSSPNLQQLPKAHGDEDNYAIRKLFIGSIDPVTKKRKKIIAVDYSNLEIRCTAHLSGDPLLLDMFAHGKDIHGTTAINMFELTDCDDKTVKQKHPDLRQAAKVLNFLLIYGGSASALYDSLKYDRSAPIDLGDKEHLAKYKKFGVKNGVDVAQVYIDKYFDSYKGVAQMIRENKKFARKHGFVYTIIKRKRRLEGINSSDNKIRSYCERLATNARVQGTASDIVSSAQVRLENDPWFEEHRCYMLVQVHDEVVYECPEEYVEEAEERIKAIMAKPFGENVSLKVELKADSDSGDSYNEAK